MSPWLSVPKPPSYCWSHSELAQQQKPFVSRAVVSWISSLPDFLNCCRKFCRGRERNVTARCRCCQLDSMAASVDPLQGWMCLLHYRQGVGNSDRFEYGKKWELKWNLGKVNLSFCAFKSKQVHVHTQLYWLFCGYLIMFSKRFGRWWIWRVSVRMRTHRSLRGKGSLHWNVCVLRQSCRACGFGAGIWQFCTRVGQLQSEDSSVLALLGCGRFHCSLGGYQGQLPALPLQHSSNSRMKEMPSVSGCHWQHLMIWVLIKSLIQLAVW